MNGLLVRWSLFAGLSLATILIYLPGLDSGFYLDDAYNLHLLERIPAEGIASFVFSGMAGPSGRPISLFTFALQYQSWPDAAGDFKAVNLGLHIANGLLVYLIAGRLAGRIPSARGRHASAIALLTAGLWLLHPMQMSTVLYVVQRMTQLSALFMFLGLYGYLLGRSACERGEYRRGYAVMSASIVAGTVAATFSKENGALLPLLVLVVDAILLRSNPLPRPWPAWRLVFLVLPCAALVAYLAFKLPDAAAGYRDRDYGILQKTLTEGTVLWQYLFNLLLPRPGAFGLYHDDVPVAGGLLDPPHTLFALLGLALLVGAAIRVRSRLPVPAFAVLWFLAGHLLESTHIDLEIYFEHRNYLPSFGVAFAVAWAAVSFASAPGRWWAPAGATLYLCLLSWISLQNSLMARVPLLQAYDVVRNHPESFGAHALLGNRYIVADRPWEALELYRRMEEFFPRLVYPRLKRIAVRACVVDETIDDASWQELLHAAGTGRPVRYEVVIELDSLLSAVFADDCTLEPQRVLAVVEALAGNPAFATQRGILHELAANLCLSMAEWPGALSHLEQAVRFKPTWNRRLRLVEIELSLGMNDAAAAKLAALEADLALQPLARLSYAPRLDRIREKLAAP